MWFSTVAPPILLIKKDCHGPRTRATQAMQYSAAARPRELPLFDGVTLRTFVRRIVASAITHAYVPHRSRHRAHRKSRARICARLERAHRRNRRGEIDS